MIVKAELTELDIATGERADCDRCALSLSLSRAVKAHVRVFHSTANVSLPEGEIVLCDLPAKVIYLRQEIDAGCPVKPQKFNIAVPGPIWDLLAPARAWYDLAKQVASGLGNWPRQG